VSRAAIFLDRDGTIIEERGYLGDPESVVLERGVVKGLRAMTAMGYPMLVVSNQSGIARGYFSYDVAVAVNRRVAELLEQEGVFILDWYICPHSPDGACTCRKPAPGMVERAAREHCLDLRKSFVIGDKRADVELGFVMGGKGILVSTGHGMEYVGWARTMGHPVCSDLVEAGDLIRANAARGQVR
jgi:D-glycero-D-manno-heptose 1,7-bisphosphate phosphatase